MSHSLACMLPIFYNFFGKLPQTSLELLYGFMWETVLGMLLLTLGEEVKHLFFSLCQPAFRPLAAKKKVRRVQVSNYYEGLPGYRAELLLRPQLL